MKKIFALFFFFPTILLGQIRLPLAMQTPPRGTSHAEMINFLKEVVAQSDSFAMELKGSSTKNREIPVVYFPPKNQWKSENSTVLLFAQQHGNEPSGKEALLMLIYELYLNPNYQNFNNLNLIIVPMVNPDGNEADSRLNGRHFDLNRNHVILTEPETFLLHQVFERYKPEVTLDIHEYGYTTWLKQGFIKDFGEQFDCLTNPAIPQVLRNFALNEILQPTLNATNARGVKANRYLITAGDLNYFVRHSTTDIDDGRNSFGIQNTLSFILEGCSPLANPEKIWQRSKFQLTLIESFLNICHEKSSFIKKAVNDIRANFATHPPDSVVIVADYTKKFSSPLQVVLIRTSDFQDTTIVLPDYRLEPEVLLTVKRPDAYAIKKPTEQLINLIKRHFFEHEIIDTDKTFRYEKFQFIGKDTVYYESSVTILPAGKYSSAKKIFPAGSLLIRTDNNQANQIVQIFEPQSFYGLSHYSDYAYLCEGKEYPIYRIFIDKKK